jgi:hypothetical protein
METAMQWDESRYGPICLEAIKMLHQPSGWFRISPNRYPAGANFVGSTIAGRLYVLSGECEHTSQHHWLRLSAGQFGDFCEGTYRFCVIGATEVEVVKVWELPEDVRAS